MTRLALAVLLLATACSGSHHKPAATTTASPIPSSTQAAPTATIAPTAIATPTSGPTVTAVALPGPAGGPVPKDFAPQSATFVSDRTGWVLGVSSTVPVIARTRDGGHTWRAFRGPMTGADDIAQVRFANLRDGFVTGTQLWATHDGGSTWKAVPGYAGSTAAASAGRLWVKLEVGGLRSAPVDGGAFVRENAGDHVNSFALAGSTAVVAGDASQSVLVGEHGAAFRPVAVPCAQGDSPVVGPGAQYWLLVCEGDAGLGHQAKAAFRSEDGGRTWRPSGQPPSLTGTDIYVTGDGDFVLDHQEVAVYRGGSWKVALGSDGGLSEGGFESASLGFAIGGFDSSAATEMKITRDAGRSWSTVRF